MKFKLKLNSVSNSVPNSRPNSRPKSEPKFTSRSTSTFFTDVFTPVFTHVFTPVSIPAYVPSSIAKFLTSALPVLFLVLLSSSTTATSAAASTKIDPAAAVLAALKCEPRNSEDILQAFRSLENRKSELTKDGIHFAKTGEETDEKIVLIFANGLELYGAKTLRAEMLLDGDFLVFGDFKGDADTVVQKLGLKRGDPEHVNDFVNPLPPDPGADKGAGAGAGSDASASVGAAGTPGAICPPTMRLRKTGAGRFRFGCGWCNG